MLASMACDVDVIQLVDGKVGVRVPIPSTAVNGMVLLAMLAKGWESRVNGSGLISPTVGEVPQARIASLKSKRLPPAIRPHLEDGGRGWECHPDQREVIQGPAPTRVLAVGDTDPVSGRLKLG